jgi:hypothetical protein
MIRSWQYTGSAPWQDIVDWCSQTFGTDSFLAKWETIYFLRSEDYTLFLLKWGSR